MRVTFDRQRLPGPRAEDRAGAVVSIGVFDGVHLGHLAILAENVARARELGAEPTVVTFRRHPKRVTLGRAPRTLTTLEHRLALFRRAGIEHTVALRFDAELRNLGALEFAGELLREGLDARCVVLGFDSKFGRDREGTAELLTQHGYAVAVAPKVEVAGRAVSSTAIREAVELGDLAGAESMLGRPVSILGQVVRGDALGRKLGFPTANLDLHHELHPPPGVYACRARRLPPGTQWPAQEPPGLPAVANIGHRPTVADGAAELRVEVHLLDFDEDLYGERLELEFVQHVREEQRFDGLEALVEAIGADVARAREILGPG